MLKVKILRRPSKGSPELPLQPKPCHFHCTNHIGVSYILFTAALVHVLVSRALFGNLFKMTHFCNNGLASTGSATTVWLFISRGLPPRLSRALRPLRPSPPTFGYFRYLTPVAVVLTRQVSSWMQK